MKEQVTADFILNNSPDWENLAAAHPYFAIQEALESLGIGDALVAMGQAAGQDELDFQQAVQDGLPQILDGLNNIFDAAGQAEQDAMDALATGAGQFFDMIQDLGQGASDALQDALNMLMAGLPQIDDPLSDFFNAAQRYIPPRRDPLILDLDGDGLEIVPPIPPIPSCSIIVVTA